MFQEMPVTLSRIMMVNHFQLEIKTDRTETVPSGITEPGGTERVINPT